MVLPSRLALAALLSVTMVAGSVAVAAQEASPVPAPDAMSQAPAHLHAGRCEAPDAVVQPLADAAYGSPAAGAEQVGPEIANAAMVSVSSVEMPLDELVATEHAIDVHRPGAGDESATRTACGVIGGFRTGEDLVFGLAEVNGSDYTGTAWLHDEGNSTLVTLFLVSGLAEGNGGMTATPMAGATGLGAIPAAAEVAAVVVEDGAFATTTLNLAADVPTVLHIVNVDEEPYYFRISDGLVTEIPLPANQLTAVEFTTPSAGAYAALLLEDDDRAVGLDLMPVTVE